MTGNFAGILKKEEVPDRQQLPEALSRFQREHECDLPALESEALGLIWAARRGLTETELLRLLKPTDPSQPPLANWLSLHAALQNAQWLVNRDGILNFAHDSQRAAVETAFVQNEDRRDELRLQLADDFERQPISSRTCDEIPWLLLQTESYQRLRGCLLDIDRFLEINKRDPEELRRYWVDLGEESEMGRFYLESFERWSQLEHHDQDCRQNRISDAAHELGIFLQHAGLYAEAESLIRTALDIDTKDRGSNHPCIADRLSNLASLLEKMNRLDEVEGLYRRALSISEQSFGPEHPEVAACLSNLAGFLLKTNQLDEAESLVRRALSIDEKCLGCDHPNVAFRLKILAALLQRTNRLAEAEPLIRRSLTILETSFGPDHPNLAADLSNLALVLHETNRQAEAELLVRRVLAIDKKSYGLEHTAVARDLNNLAGLLEYGGRLAEAEPLYRQAQAMFEKNLGADHPFVGTSLNNLAQVLKKMNRLSEAAPIQLRAVRIFLEFTRAVHRSDPRLQMAINNYSRLLEAMGRRTDEIHTALQEVAPELYKPGFPSRKTPTPMSRS
jgi:tetratricopeptide (TPR) repeat protein